jgi:hypothetical protein
MVTPVHLRCPHCQAPLPEVSGDRVRCEYCNHVSRLQRTIAPHQGVGTAPAPVRIEVAYDATRRIRVIVGLVTLVIVVGAGLATALVVTRVVKEASAPGPQATQIQRDIERRAANIESQALDQIEAIQREAFARVDGALDEADKARDKAKSRSKRKRKTKGRRGNKPAADPNLPEALDRQVLFSALRAVDLSKCPAPFTVVFKIRVAPNGSTRGTRVAPLDGHEAAARCVRAALGALRFPPSRRGRQVFRYRFAR